MDLCYNCYGLADITGSSCEKSDVYEGAGQFRADADDAKPLRGFVVFQMEELQVRVVVN